MKSLIVLIFTIVLQSSVLYSQWMNQNPVPNGNDLWSTFFVNDSTGWIVGSEGFIKRTTNSGVDWVPQISNTNLTLKSIQFIDENTGWICGENGLILKTTDGGQNWYELTSGTFATLTNLHFLDNEVGYAVGYYGTILKTTDGGSNWNVQISDSTYDLFSQDIVDRSTGYAVGGSCDSVKFFKTTNGGTDWIEKKIDLGVHTQNKIYTVKFINSDIGFISGGKWDTGTFIFKTTDGGETWNECTFSYSQLMSGNSNKGVQDYSEGGEINSIYFTDSNIGYAVGGYSTGHDRSIYTTTDGGNSWVLKYYGTEEDGLISVNGNNLGQAWAVGFSGAIFISGDNGNSWSQILSGNKTANYNNGDDIYSVFFINENIGWACGKRDSAVPGAGEVILKTTNGGKIWKTQLFKQDNNGAINKIFFVDSNNGWAVGKNSYYTTDGGKNWNSIGLGNISSVYFVDQTNGWLTSENKPNYQGIYKSTNGGVTWEQKSSMSSSSIYFSDLNNGWAVGENGNILKSTDGGETWISKSSGTTSYLTCIKFYDSNNGICIGNGGIILLSTDGGETWNSQISGTANNLTAVTFTSINTIWTAGDNGTILNTTDLGNKWTSYNNISSNNLNSLYFTNEYTGWFGGMNGTIIKYSNLPLPVELSAFNAEVLSDNTVKLNWRTETELNNSGFDILRQISNSNKWDKIGFVSGHGNSSLPNEYSFLDKDQISNIKVFYRLKQIDFSGKLEYSKIIEVNLNLPSKFELSQNYPNPFNPSTTISFSLESPELVQLKVYDILGKEVAELINDKLETGEHKIMFDTSKLSSGIYFYRMTAGKNVKVRKMQLLK